jgi:hypothetical protein
VSTIKPSGTKIEGDFFFVLDFIYGGIFPFITIPWLFPTIVQSEGLALPPTFLLWFAQESFQTMFIYQYKIQVSIKYTHYNIKCTIQLDDHLILGISITWIETANLSKAA